MSFASGRDSMTIAHGTSSTSGGRYTIGFYLGRHVASLSASSLLSSGLARSASLDFCATNALKLDCE